MLFDTLPDRVVLRKLFHHEAVVEAKVGIKRFTRVCEAIDGLTEDVSINLHFYKDSEGYKRITGSVTTPLKMLCQRCLSPVVFEAKADVNLVLVWTEEQAEALPRDFDPLIHPEDECDLAVVVEEEILLSIPLFAYHDEQECSISDDWKPTEQDAPLVKEKSKDNPFDVLKGLKANSLNKQEK